MKRWFSGLLGVGLLFSVYAEKRPSFILLLTDDQSYHLGMLGVPGLETPNMDALAKSGVFFTKAYSASASCAPCRSSILTGMNPHSNGHWRNTHGPVLSDPEIEFTRQSSKSDPVGIHEDIPTLIEALNDKGYFTGITEKWHLSPSWKFPFHFRDQADLTPAGSAKAVSRFIEAADGKPFFLQANVDNTHRPFQTNIKQNKDLPRVNPDAVEVPPNWPDTPKTRQDYAEYLTTVQHADAVVGAIIETVRKHGQLDNTIFIYSSDQGFCYHRAKASAYDWGVHVPLAFAGPGVKQGAVLLALVGHVDIMPTILDFAGIPIPETVEGKSLRCMLDGRADGVGRKYIVAEHNAHGPAPEEYYPTRSITDGRYRYIWNLRHEIVPDFPVERYATDPTYREKPKSPAWMPWDATPGAQWENNAFEEIIFHKDEFPAQYELLKATFHRSEYELYDLEKDPYEMNNLAGDPELVLVAKRMDRALKEWMKENNDIGDPRSVKRRTGRTISSTTASGPCVDLSKPSRHSVLRKMKGD